MKHNNGHIQILLKDNIVIAELVFNTHDNLIINETIKKFDYTQIINTCEEEIAPAGLGSFWNGEKLIPKPFKGWHLNENFEWEAPFPKPGDDFSWDDYAGLWLPKTIEENEE
jgi:hypothetical protein